MSSLGSICRFCLKNGTNNEFSSLDAALKEKLQQVSPELKLTPSTDPVVCNPCKNFLEESYKLKRSCSSGNKLIRFLRNHLGITYPIELRELLKGNNKKHDEKCCRICLKCSESVYIPIKDAKSREFGSVLTSCLLPVDENLILNPLICKICTNAFQNMCTFMKQLTDVENRIKLYNEKFPSISVDLLKVLNSEKKNLSSESEINNQVVEVTPACDLTSEEVTENNSDSKSHPFSEEHDDDLSMIVLDEIEDDESEMLVTEPNMGFTSDFTIHSDGLPSFEFTRATLLAPHRKRCAVADWVKQVEEIKAKNNWSDIITKHKILGRMKKLPALHSWFSSVADIVAWEDWKEKLIHAFPDKDDFFTKNLRMMKRRKGNKETFVAYYNDKLALLEDMNLSKKEMVSCLLGGVSDIMVLSTGRMGKHNTPEELLEHFKMCDDRVAAKQKKKPLVVKQAIQPSNDKQTEDNKGNETCSKCQGSDHLEEHCLWKPKKLIVLLENTKIDTSDFKCEVPQSNIENQENSNLNCSCCDQNGHLSLDCPLIKSNKISQVIPTGNAECGTKNNDIFVKENIVSEVTEKSKNDKHKETLAASSKDQKCMCCDKLGHSSMDCPLIRGKPKVQQTQGHKKSSDNLKKIDDVIVIHDDDDDDEMSRFEMSISENTNDSQKNTPSSRTNIRITFNKGKVKPSVPNVSEIGKDDLVCEDNLNKQRLSQNKCLCCNKEGHTSLNCPFISPQDTHNRSRQSTEESTDQTKNKGTQSKNKPNQCLGCNKSGHSTLDCPLIKMSRKDNVEKNAGEKNKAEVYQDKTKVKESRKCLGCNKGDHSTVNCPLINGSSNTQQKQKKDVEDQKQNKYQKPNTSRKCLTCNKSDHSSENCYLGRVNRNKSDQKNNSKITEEKTVFTTCLGCNNVGHTVLNCPFIGVNKNNITRQAREEPIKARKNENKTIPETSQASEKCSACNKFGHSVFNCLLINVGKTSSNRRNVETMRGKSETPASSSRMQDAKQDAEKTNQPERDRDRIEQNDGAKCSFCNKPGHKLDYCPFHSFFLQTNSSASSDIPTSISKSQENLKRTLESNESDDRYDPYNPEVTYRPSQKRNRNESHERCVYCNEFGHSDVDCPQRRRSLQSSWPPRHENPNLFTRERERPRVPTCDLCNRVGHRMADCPSARFDTRGYGSYMGGSVSRQCLGCGKFGHPQAECPKSKRPQRRRF